MVADSFALSVKIKSLLVRRSKSLLSIAVLCLMSACGQELESSYEIIDSGFIAKNDGKSVWLDNYRVVFEGYGGDKPRTVEERDPSKWGLYLWDTQSNQVSLFAAQGSRVCFVDNYISYRIPSIDPNDERPLPRRYDRIAGLLGSEINESELQRQQGLEPTDISRQRNRFCQNLSAPELMVESGRRNYRVLMHAHGYLEIPVELESDQVALRLHRFDESEVLELPFTGIAFIGPVYAPWKDAYFIYKSFTRQPLAEQSCGEGGWFWPDGRSELMCIPLDVRWSSGRGTLLQPVKSGFFLAVYYDEYQGGYLLRDYSATKITDGLLHQVSVSPDGCKVAFSYRKDLEALRPGGRGKVTLKMFDTCELESTASTGM